MSQKAVLLFAIFLFISFTAKSGETWQWHHKKLTGVYGIYGGGLGDPIAPSPHDKKVMFSIDGQSARELFQAIGPDVKDACTSGSRVGVRKKDGEHLFCQRDEDGAYFCNFGYDLTNGKSIGGITC